MTGREGETFPGFFYGRRGQPDTDEREVRSSQEEGDGLGMPSLRVRRHLWAGRGRCQGGRRRFRGAVSGDVRKDRAVDALRGPHSGVACSGIFGGGSIFLCLFGMLIE